MKELITTLVETCPIHYIVSVLHAARKRTEWIGEIHIYPNSTTPYLKAEVRSVLSNCITQSGYTAHRRSGTASHCIDTDRSGAAEKEECQLQMVDISSAIEATATWSAAAAAPWHLGNKEINSR